MSIEHELQAEKVVSLDLSEYIVVKSGLAEDIFSTICPYTLIQILDENFYPK